MDDGRLLRILDELGTPGVLIVGDLILDRYVTGEVARISPEAPIPVLAARHVDLRLGGAGNVGANLRSMGARVELLGVVGQDERGATLLELLESIGIGVAGVHHSANRPTTQKTRLIGGTQQILRVDWEEARPLSTDGREALLAGTRERIRGAGAVVLSDYGKGTLTDEVLAGVIGLAREHGVPVLVDPKGADWSRYRGATLVTPNLKEAEQALGRPIGGLDELPEVADRLMELADLEGVLVTLGPQGIYWASRRGLGEGRGRVPTMARAVFDVTGAGDTVIAHLALGLADGRTLEESVRLANHAAGIAVGRRGAVSLTRAELRAALGERTFGGGAILAPNELAGKLAEWRAEGKRIVFTNGCFDLLHAGHVGYLRDARARGDVLLVGVNDDASVRRLKGEERPIVPLADRLTVLAALEMVDAVVPFPEDTPERLVVEVTPDILVKGRDWEDKGVVGREWVESHGGEVVLVPLLAGRSTTSLVERLEGRA